MIFLVVDFFFFFFRMLVVAFGGCTRSACAPVIIFDVCVCYLHAMFGKKKKKKVQRNSASVFVLERGLHTCTRPR